jgi:hypothetical protein
MSSITQLSVASLVIAQCAVVLITGATALAAGERNDGDRAHRHRSNHHAAPLKDCTRFNGRWGYYGNPWCTQAEQRRFDRWEAKRINRQRLK